MGKGRGRTHVVLARVHACVYECPFVFVYVVCMCVYVLYVCVCVLCV